MKNLKISYKLLIGFTVLFAVALGYLYFFFFIPTVETIMTSTVMDRMNNAMNLSTKTLDRAFSSKDDLAVLSKIDELMKIDGVSTAYIIDSNGIILSHDKPSEWDKIYTDKFSAAAIQAAAPLTQRYPDDSGYLFSDQISSGTILCVSYSTDKAAKTIQSLQESFLFHALIALIVLGISWAFFIYMTVSIRFNKLSHLLQSISLSKKGLINDSSNDEVGTCSQIIDSILSSSAGTQTTPSNATETSTICNELAEKLSVPVLLLDEDNRVIAYNKLAQSTFALTSSPQGQHILEATTSKELLELIHRSGSAPQKPIEGSINNATVTVVTYQETEKNLNGTIITGK